MRGLADQRDAVAPRKLRAVSTASGKTPRPGSTVILPRIECERRFDLDRERGIVERAQALGFRRIDHPDQARALARQRHQRERAGRGMEFGRDVVVRPRVAKVEGQRDLRIVPAVDLDAGGGAAERARAVGADDQLGGQMRRRFRE